MTELKPCPFCGGEATAIDGSKQVWCSDCYADGPFTEEHIAAWNRRASGWVSVEERLPEKAKWSGDRVLVYTEEGYIHTGLYEGEAATDDDPWWDKFNDSGYVTHWMPLPEPPEVP